MIWYVILLLVELTLGLVSIKTDYQTNLNKPVLIGGYKHTTIAEVCFICMSAAMIFLAAFRYQVGTDYNMYYLCNPQYVNSVWDSVKHVHEPLYPLIAAGCSIFSPSPSLPIGICALLTISLIMATLYRSSGNLLYSTLMFLFFMFLETMNLVRQMLAVAIIFSGVMYLKDQKFIKYAVLVFIGFLAHASSVIMLPIYFFFKVKLNWKTLLIILGISILGCIFSTHLIELAEMILRKGYIYHEEWLYTPVNPIRVAVHVAPALFALFLYRKDKTTDDEAFALKACVLHAALSIAFARVVYLTRTTWFTAPLVCLCFPELTKKIEGKKRVFINIGILGLYMCYWIVDILSHPNIVNFMFIWNK